MSERLSIPPSSGTASVRTAKAYVLFNGAGGSQVSPLAASASRTASYCSCRSGMPSGIPR